MIHDLIADGNSVVLVDHDTQLLAQTDWIIEMGPGAGAEGGRVVATGTPQSLSAEARSQIGPFLRPFARRASIGAVRAPGVANGEATRVSSAELFAQGFIHLETDAVHTVKPLAIEIPKGRLTVVTVFRLGQDNVNFGEPGAGAGGAYAWGRDAGSCEGGLGRGH